MGVPELDLNRIETDCRTIARQAGRILLKHFTRPLQIDFKGKFDMVTNADLEVENHIISALHESTPDIPIMSEETADSHHGSDPTKSCFLWVVDPLDGTTNFAHGFPHFCVSIALCLNLNPILGVIFNPCTDELFHTRFGMGAFLNNAPLTVSATTDLEHSLLVTGFPYKVRELKQNNLIDFCVFRLRCQGVRRVGAAALDLAYIASGRFDGYWERWLKPWDTAAGILLVKEAGGIVTLYDQTEFSIVNNEILASNGLIHAQMSSLLTSSWPELPLLMDDV